MQSVFEILLITMISAGILHLLGAYFIFRNKMKNQIQHLNYSPKVTILKPLKGIDDNIEENLNSFFELDYPNYDIIFGVQSQSDDVISIVKKVQSNYTKIKSKLVIDSFAIGLNPKVNNMYNMYDQVNGEMILISDSNTKVDKDFLTKLVSDFYSEENVGAITATIRGTSAKNTASIWENLHLNNFIAPNIFFSSTMADIQIVVGKAILMPTKVLDEIGGLFGLRNYLAEDFMIGKLVKEAGYIVKNSITIVDNPNENISFEKFFNRHTRWAKMRKNIDFPHYIMEILANPIFNSFILMIIMWNILGIEQFFLVTLFKIGIDFATSRILQSDIKWFQFLQIIPKDLSMVAVWITPFVSGKVKWRENKVKIGKMSILQPALGE